MLRYRLTLEQDDNDTILVTSPDLPVVTYGADEAEAIRQAADAIRVMIESLMNSREIVPIPVFEDTLGVNASSVSLQTELKVRLHNAMVTSGLTRADLQRELKWQGESVDRLFRVDHNSRLDQIEAAFKALRKDIGVDIKEAALKVATPVTSAKPRPSRPTRRVTSPHSRSKANFCPMRLRPETRPLSRLRSGIWPGRAVLVQ